MNQIDVVHQQMEALAEYIEGCDSDPDQLGSIEFIKMAVGLAQKVNALNNYLKRGGILPRHWRDVIGVPKDRRPS